MVKCDIERLRNKLNQLIEIEFGYEEIYRVSTELDQLIVTFYKEKNMPLSNNL